MKEAIKVDRVEQPIGNPTTPEPGPEAYLNTKKVKKIPKHMDRRYTDRDFSGSQVNKIYNERTIYNDWYREHTKKCWKV